MSTEKILAQVDYLFENLQKDFTAKISACVGSLDIATQNQLIAHTTNIFNQVAVICGWKFLTLFRACSEWDYLQGFVFSFAPKESQESEEDYTERLVGTADNLRHTSFSNNFSDSLVGQMFKKWEDYPDLAELCLPKEDCKIWSIPDLSSLSDVAPRLTFRTKEGFGHDRFSILLMSKELSSTANNNTRVEYIFQVGIEYRVGTQRLELAVSSTTHEKVLMHIFSNWQALLLSIAESFEIKAKTKTEKDLKLSAEAQALVDAVCAPDQLPTEVLKQPTVDEKLQTIIVQNNEVISQNQKIIKNQHEILKVLKEIRDDYSA